MRSLWIAVVMATGVWADWHYRIYSPLVGELGRIGIHRTEDAGEYRIEGEAVTTGVAALLTGNRREWYRSDGVVRMGDYLSRHFRIERWMKKKRQIDDYRIDPHRRRVQKRKIRWKNGRRTKDERRDLGYFTREDLMTLYHNLLPRMLRVAGGKRLEAVAVGAEKIGGKVTVIRASAETEKRERRRLGVGPETMILIVTSGKEILGRKNRRLILGVDGDGVLRKARLLALPVVGEVFIERIGE